jgi:hypothetical protein
MKTWAAVVAAGVIAGCVNCPTGDAPTIVGTWQLKPQAADARSLNPTCESTVEYRADGTFLTRNGEMEITGRYSLGTEADTLYYCEWAMRGNGAKSCQGLTSDFVIAHTRPKRRAVVEGNALKLYSSASTYFTLERKSYP